MGLIDKVRDERDSWTRRFEEMRQEHGDEELEGLSEQEQEKIIQRNREKVGKFSFDKKDK